MPSRLGTGFRWLLGSSWISNLGDGIALAAGAAAGRLADRRGISRSARRALQWAPPLLFGLYAGVLTDRLNRKLIVVVTNVIRVLVLFVLAASIFIGFLSIALVLVAMFLLGTAETFADNASTTVSR